MGSFLLSLTSFASSELLNASVIEQEGNVSRQVFLAAAEVPPTPPAGEAEQKEEASGDVQERGLLGELSGIKGDTLKIAPPTTTTTAPCPTILPATPPSPSWTYKIMGFNGNVNTLPTPHWLSENGSNACTGCTYFGTSLWKSKVGGGIENVAFGQSALYETNCGTRNTAFGFQALNGNISGSGNTAAGHQALLRNVSGAQNTAIGKGALYNVTTGINNTALGYAAGFYQLTGSNNIYIGNSGENGESRTIRIGTGTSATIPGHTRIFLAGIDSPLTAGNALFGVGGQVGIMPSSRRFKEDIHDLGKASEGLQRLRPVAFRYKADAVAGGGAQDYGLIAEEVAEVYPELVGRNAEGEIITVHYHKLIPMLLNELQQQQTQILRQQRKNEELEARLTKLESK